MFDVGFWEILLILMLALLVLGPERLPQAARSVGYWVGKARRYIEGVKDQVESEFDSTELKRLLHNQDVQIKELQNKITDTGSSIAESYTDDLDVTDGPEVHHDEPQYEILEEDDEDDFDDDDEEEIEPSSKSLSETSEASPKEKTE